MRHEEWTALVIHSTLVHLSKSVDIIVSTYGVILQCHMIFLSVDDRSVSVQVVLDQLDAETGLCLECGYHFVRYHHVYVT